MESIIVSDNLLKLKELVDELENHNKISTEYDIILQKIHSIITLERKVIQKLKRPDAKLKRYESLCTGILALIVSNP